MAILNTILAIFISSLVWTLAIPFSPNIGTAIGFAFISLMSIVGAVSGWVVALKRPGTVSIWWKIFSFSTVAVLAYGILSNLVYYLLYPS